MQYGVRVSLEVEKETADGDDTLELVIRGTSEAENAAEAMKNVAAGVKQQVAEKLEGSHR